MTTQHCHPFPDPYMYFHTYQICNCRYVSYTRSAKTSTAIPLAANDRACRAARVNAKRRTLVSQLSALIGAQIGQSSISSIRLPPRFWKPSRWGKVDCLRLGGGAVAETCPFLAKASLVYGASRRDLFSNDSIAQNNMKTVFPRPWKTTRMDDG